MNPRITMAAAVAAAVLALANCGPKPHSTASVASNPTAKADEKVLVAKATATLNACLPPGVHAQKTPLATMVQPVMTDDFLHHGTRKDILDCWYLHGVKRHVGSCVLLAVAESPSDLTSTRGREMLGQSIFTGCLVTG